MLENLFTEDDSKAIERQEMNTVKWLTARLERSPSFTDRLNVSLPAGRKGEQWQTNLKNKTRKGVRKQAHFYRTKGGIHSGL